MFGMKCAALCLLLVAPGAVAETPVARVVALVRSLQAKIEADGMVEQKGYDKYACWCENTLARKAADISQEKDMIDKLQMLITKLKGELAAHAVEIEQLKKDITANVEAQREAAEVRGNENEEYEKERSESEQCIGALEAATKVLTGAGTGKKGFLETLQEAQLLSVVDGVRRVLKTSVAKTVPDADIAMVTRFVDKPEDFIGGRSGVLNAAQIANNPFGDYAPQSTQIQGILKGMYDAFTGDLEKANAEESGKQKSFEALMATKKQEEETLQATLQTQTLDEAEKTKQLSDSKTSIDDTSKQLKADEAFFAETKESCKIKAGEWAERTRLRTEELHGIGKAIEILTSPEAQQIFQNSSTTFVQISASTQHANNDKRNAAYTRLSALATRYHSVSLAEVAAALTTGGHFDKIIVSIDQMIALLRAEEQEDITHRDRCQNSQRANENEMEDLNHDIDKTTGSIERMGNSAVELKAEISALEDKIKDTQNNMDQMLEMRNGENSGFKQALKDDADAVELIQAAIVSLEKFYKKNKIPLMLAQAKDPEYTVDDDKAPETNWSGANYGGAKSESGGIIAIFTMLVDDIKNEMKTGRAEDAEAQARYVKDRQALKKTLDADVTAKVAAEGELADLEGKINDADELKDAKAGDLGAQEELKGALGHDCAWVEDNFETRRVARKAEMDGLVDAKNALAGVESGDDDLVMGPGF